MIELVETQDEVKQSSITKIKVVGTGGAGNNAINRMIDAGVKGVEFIAVNTDAQVLRSCKAEIKVQIGSKLTKGLGAGSVPEVGRDAALEDKDKLEQVLKGADMVFITAGMGGGTGTGSAPVIAEISKSIGALTVGVVTKPFTSEGITRIKRAEEGIKNLKGNVDSLIVIPNDKILKVVDPRSPVEEAYKVADEILRYGVEGISNHILYEGFINLDFNDVKKVMSTKGSTVFGMGSAEGEERDIKAIEMALNSHLLEDTSIETAKNVLLNIMAAPNSLALQEKMNIIEAVRQKAKEAEIFVGIVFDKKFEDMLAVTLIATGIENYEQNILKDKEHYIDKKMLSNKTFPNVDNTSYSDNSDEIFLSDSSEKSSMEIEKKKEKDHKDDSLKDFLSSLYIENKKSFGVLSEEIDGLNIPTYIRKKLLSKK